MRRILYAFLSALALTALAAALDYFAFVEDFGLWAYTLGTIAGLGLALLGLIYSIVKLLFSRRKGPGLALGALFILTGILTFLLSLAVWLLTGKSTLGTVLFVLFPDF